MPRRAAVEPLPHPARCAPPPQQPPASPLPQVPAAAAAAPPPPPELSSGRFHYPDGSTYSGEFKILNAPPPTPEGGRKGAAKKKEEEAAAAAAAAEPPKRVRHGKGAWLRAVHCAATRPSVARASASRVCKRLSVSDDSTPHTTTKDWIHHTNRHLHVRSIRV